MLEKFVKDIRFGGVINNIIYTASNIYMQYYLTTQSTAFEGFKLIHHILWYSMLLYQNIYIFQILNTPKEHDSYMDRAIYDWFTAGGINSYKNILIATEIEPLFEYFILFLFVLIPWPILKNVSFKRRFLLIFAKIGIFHFVSGLVLINWKTYNVDYEKRAINSNSKND
jgi:hypothetical protein